MSVEEAIEILERKTTIPNDGESFDTINEAFDMAIKALKHMDDFGKIRAEVESKEMVETTSEREFYNMALHDVLQIIDKYTKE